ncbi:hypothetical protein D9615_001115 [Tricholomella constricta]|uniref:Uncharacterized protein n=1 Tax=Tricholomella constricta TaxID=117010 RepID=A0A8H5HKV0_9AGAR|nr:hypothetical protein D9615_001115 [Tricholomella constricta]
MLAVRSHPPPMSMPQWRGRSRQVSHAALARQASEERRRTRVSNEKSDGAFQPSVSPPPPMHNVLVTAPVPAPAFIPPSPPTSSLAPDYYDSPPPPSTPVFITPPPPSSSSAPDYYDSPPSPPRSLADQVHVAYALEDMHLAKVLLLRLKGINVTSPDDPRIAAVKDEDFDFCFVPHGRLMDEEDEKALKERQKMELERLEQRQREERLRDCERIWEQGKERLREAKALAVRRREAEQQQRRAEESRKHVSARRPRTPTAPPRSVVTYKLVPSSKRREEEPFVYDFMPRHAPSRPLIKPQTPSRPKSKSPFSRSRFDDTRAVPFSDVLTSMQGPLFPHDRRPLSRHDRDVDLLDTLLRVVEWEDDERRRRKGKAPARPPLRRNGSEKSCVMCCESSSLASSSSSLSSLSPTPSRRSWLSFSSASSSTSTAATTPSSSPPTWFTKSASPTRKPRPKPWFLTPSSCTPSPLSHPCKPCSHLTLVSPAESPLPITFITDPKYPHLQSSHRLTTPASHTSPTHSADDPHAPTSPVLRRLSQFLDLAKGFQHAYMNATMFAVAASTDALDDRRHAAALLASFSARKHARSPRPHSHPLRPSGQRVRPADVKAFLDSTPPHPHSDSDSPTPSSPRPIPLRTRNTNEDGDGDDAADAEPPRTVLPDPLPYPIRFKPHPASPRSPFRVHAHLCGGGGEGQVVLRVRAVENPLYLRVLAAGNVAASRYWSGSLGMGVGMGIEGVVMHEGMLGSGREKVLQIACEGIGRSSLGVEVQVQVGSGAVGAGAGMDDAPWRFGEAAVRGRRGRQAWW